MTTDEAERFDAAHRNDDCGRWRLAEAYVLRQEFGKRYSFEEALYRGTLWPALYRPYPY
jgi:hypothetical protein